ncbi:hypothetical protein cand_007030 [Cryptosporidium andersoni]|uniref:Uncharacterized protein n=1 Tax=Cryptosporidium andersoni TaxID=117008 RepID=A0A1J4MPC9_9CRYT|nr:hypothetical protein cand_007030 [Cryptosporidium andersoni]
MENEFNSYGPPTKKTCLYNLFSDSNLLNIPFNNYYVSDTDEDYRNSSNFSSIVDSGCQSIVLYKGVDLPSSNSKISIVNRETEIPSIMELPRIEKVVKILPSINPIMHLECSHKKRRQRFWIVNEGDYKRINKSINHREDKGYEEDKEYYQSNLKQNINLPEASCLQQDSIVNSANQDIFNLVFQQQIDNYKVTNKNINKENCEIDMFNQQMNID